MRFYDYQTKSDGTAYGSPIESSIEVDPAQFELCESSAPADGIEISFGMIRLWKSPDLGWTKSLPKGESRSLLQHRDFAEIKFPERDKEADLIEAKFLETLREFAWEVWKASAKSDDQSRETFDKFYTDLSNS